MVKVFIVFAHPERKSFNGALFDTAVEHLQSLGHEVKVSDLYRQKFNPVSDRSNFTSVKNPEYYKQQVEETYATEVNGFAADVEEEIQKIEWADIVIFQFPLWWFGLPGILKGWVDRVLAAGRTYGGGRMYEKGVFKGKRALVSTTTGGPEAAYLKDGGMGDIYGILRPIHRGIFQFVGFDVLEPFFGWSAAHVTDEQRQAYLAQWREKLSTIDTAPILDVGRY
eukprot:TRINITY_DN32629_c0_g1_i1.p1 TRINITY_DN32629_c0_g1~~TRINITY_DN32629_c0_g1_i1.p1  ORF type:complete len:231 (-),score=57.73 TRINITY_DN32629_c0_g1_i1:130-801(-)